MTLLVKVPLAQGETPPPQHDAPPSDEMAKVRDKASVRLGEEVWSKNHKQQTSGPYFVSKKITEEEKQYMRSIKPSDALSKDLDDVLSKINQEQNEKWAQIKEVVNRDGLDPVRAISNAVENNRLVILGEQHTMFGVNPQRLALAGMMQDFRDKGVTHLAIEMPKSMQPLFDGFSATHSKSLKQYMESPPNKMSIGIEDYQLLDKMLTLCPDLDRMWTAASEAGLKIQCVDNVKLDGLPRETFLKNEIMSTMREAGTKVVFCTGNLHAIDTRGAAPLEERRAAELIRSEMNARGERMTTFVSILGAQEGDVLSLFPLAKQLDRPVSVPTHDRVTGKPNAIADVNMLKVGVKGVHSDMGNYDEVVFYPPLKSASTRLRLANSPESMTELYPLTDATETNPLLDPATFDEVTKKMGGTGNLNLPHLQLVG